GQYLRADWSAIESSGTALMGGDLHEGVCPRGSRSPAAPKSPHAVSLATVVRTSVDELRSGDRTNVSGRTRRLCRAFPRSGEAVDRSDPGGAELLQASAAGKGRCLPPGVAGQPGTVARA